MCALTAGASVVHSDWLLPVVLLYTGKWIATGSDVPVVEPEATQAASDTAEPVPVAE